MVEKSERTEVNREEDDESFCPGKLTRMTRLVHCGRSSQKDREVSSLTIRETGKDVQKVRIGFLPDLIMQGLSSASPPCQRTLPLYNVFRGARLHVRLAARF